GIVHPVDMMANRPWSEDLLDYLAGYLVDEKYDLKKLIELILTSQAYQSRAVPLAQEQAADDYRFRGPEVKRLTAEQFMDAVWLTPRTAPARPFPTVPAPANAWSVPAERRFVRAALVPANALLRSLGRPNREQVVTTRPDQLTTLQALDLANGQLLTDTLNRGARNWLKAHGGASGDGLIEDLYLRALCRRPTAEELGTARRILCSPPTPAGL